MSLIGRTVGKYEIVSRLGAGGMGEVFVARDPRLGRSVALKILPPAMAKDPERLARFEREARAVAALRHPGIVTIHSIDEADGLHFLTMELVDGAPLSARVSGDGLPTDQLLDLAVQLAEALGAAHAQGITHRDLKPANVMIDADGRAKVLDFGLAKSAGPAHELSASSVDDETELASADPNDGSKAHASDSLTADGRIVGTVHYMSPEQAEGKDVGPTSDVFALGILIYEMATGERPFRGETSISVLSSILKDDPAPVSSIRRTVPGALDAIVQRCLAKDPAQRFSDANQLGVELQRLRDEEAVSPSVSRSAVSRQAVPFWQRRAVHIGLAVALGAFVLGLRPILFPGGDRPEAPPAMGASGRPSIAVFEFRDHSGDEEIRWLAAGVPSMLLTGLAQTPGLDVVSSARVEEILEKIGRERAEEIDQTILSEVARRSGAGAVVVGNIFKSGDVIRIDVQVEDVETGKLLFAQEASGSDVFPIVDRLTTAIRDGLALDHEDMVQRPMTEVSSNSLEAYRHFVEGKRAFDAIRFADATRSIEAALALDPEFAMAHFVHSALDLAQGEFVSGLEHLNRAWDLRDRLPARERAMVESSYELHVERDVEAARETLEELLRRFPGEEDAYVLLGSHEFSPGLNEQLEILSRGVAEIPTSGRLRNQYAYVLNNLGRHDEAIHQLELYAELEPEEVNPLDSMAEIYQKSGHSEKAFEIYGRVLKMDPSFATAHMGRSMALAVMGRLDEAIEEYDQALLVNEATGLSNRGIAAPKALLLLQAGRIEEATTAARDGDVLSQTGVPTGFVPSLVRAMEAFRAQDYERCVRLRSDLRDAVPVGAPEIYRRAMQTVVLSLLGTAAARAEDFRAAEASRDSLLALGVHLMFPWAADWLEGEIALARGDLDLAEAAFRRGTPELTVAFQNGPQALFGTLLACHPPSRDWEARVREARGDLTGAIEVYERLNAMNESSRFLAMYDPVYTLETARLWDRHGDIEAAAGAYERFLDDWASADPDRPELREARQFLASLSG